MTSWKNHTPKTVTTTPRTADDTMCVMGDVTLMLMNPAMQIRNPNNPCAQKNGLQQPSLKLSGALTVRSVTP